MTKNIYVFSDVSRVALLGTSVNFTFTFNGNIKAVVNGIIPGDHEKDDEKLRARNISWVKATMGATQEYVIQVPATLANNGTTVIWILNGMRVTDTTELIVVTGKLHFTQHILWLT